MEKAYELDTADARIAGLQEQTDFCLAKLIDRLHRVAHHKQGAPIALFPPGGQRHHQVELRERRVLKLIDQNVP